ncbi:triacylglycerol lipase 2-like isoform X1 [Magnolia sinica]|uniref:triacylglycerol lipase 2-like isoform X1 n=1 Tax=Magnolia sinica TaxID=86752 RepID=UPI002659ABB2|nr:triacylglycerol lipase 2-like isoform X1 [Magnolia sinica]
MAIHCLGRVLVAIFFVVIMIEPDPAVGLRKSDLLTINGHDPVSVPTTTLVGICESLVIVHGYPCIEYNVKTEDGFVLSMQRIPDGLVKGNGGNNKQPVLLQHGVLMDGMTWLLESPDQSLGFVLADNGYDVWIANSRGTRWSRGHASLDPANPAYWNWSWDEMVDYDLTANLDFVYSQTGQKVDYVGHSMGTLIALAAFSQGKLTDRIKSAALLCPVAYLSHMTTAIGELAARAFVGEITTWLGIAEFNPKGKAVADFLKTLCANPGVDCFDLIRSFTGKNCCLNESTVDLFLKYEPQSTATKNMVHLAQTVRDGIIMKYDYGNGAANIMRYGEIRPPIYNMSNIPHDLPLFLSYGGQDALADTRDVGLLLDALKFHDGDKLTVQFVKDYAHADFVLGVTAKNIVYDAIIAFFRRQ